MIPRATILVLISALREAIIELGPTTISRTLGVAVASNL